jgi:hypothetical protein
MALTIYDFNRLSQAERAEHVFHFGTYLATCPERGNLYSMGDFFAEVIYNGDVNEIQQVRAFRTQKNLEPYLEGLDISLDAEQ